MKTFLPVLKTKLFLLSFASACIVILATTPHNGGSVVVNIPATSADIATNNAQMEVAPGLNEFDVKAFRNFSGDQFTLYLENATNEKVSIVVFDSSGREVKRFEKENGNIPIHFGLNFKGGVYVVEVRQGNNQKTLKLVKQ